MLSRRPFDWATLKTTISFYVRYSFVGIMRTRVSTIVNYDSRVMVGKGDFPVSEMDRNLQ